jgi:hypothetical protein
MNQYHFKEEKLNKKAHKVHEKDCLCENLL